MLNSNATAYTFSFVSRKKMGKNAIELFGTGFEFFVVVGAAGGRGLQHPFGIKIYKKKASGCK